MSSDTPDTITNAGGARGDKDPVVHRAFKELTGKHAWRKVVFKTSGGPGSIEVDFNDQSFRFLIHHQERQSLRLKLKELGLLIPAAWVVMGDRKKTLLSSGLLEIVARADERHAVEEFVYLVGREVFSWGKTRQVSARLQR